MRILRIRGENLGSLERFEIDFIASPLAESGLFAITGPTGAGKTTLLDALTLALYGDYPRVSGSGTAKIPDPSGQSMGSNDPRAILRRGAGSGCAECEFVGIDGEGYRARWNVSRAHGRVAGNIQPAGRVISRLSDGSVVATGITDVGRAVVTLTGLDFGQFRRLVLLAQGEFDVFLMASEQERVTLLERITDTEVYTRLSVRVHQGTQERRSRVDRLRERLDGIGLMSPEQREALAANIEAARQGRLDLTAQRTLLNDAIEVTARVARADDAWAAAGHALAGALSRAEAATEERSLLAAHDLAGPLRPLAAERSRTERDLARLAAERAKASEADVLLRQAAEGSTRLLGEAGRVHEEVEDAVTALAPEWAEAGRLDDLCRDAERDEQNDTGTLAQRAEEVARRGRLADSARRAVGEVEGRRAAIAERLDVTAAHDLLADDEVFVAGLFASRIDALGLVKELSVALADATAKAGAARKEVEASAAVRLALDETRTEVDGELSDLRSRRSALAIPSLQARKTSLGRLAMLAAEQRLTHRAYLTAVAKGRAAERERAAETAKEEEAKTRRLGAASAIEAKEAERRGLAMAVTLADGAASRGAATLRALLVEGQPCPVCGAVEYRRGADDLEAFAADLHGALTALGAEIERMSLSMSAAAADASAARARAEQAERRRGEADREEGDARRILAATEPGLEEALASAAVSCSIPGIDDADAERAWSALSESVRESVRPVDDALAEAERLGQAIDDAVGRRDAVLEDIEGTGRLAREATDLVQALAVKIASIDAKVGEARRTAEAARSTLIPYLSAAAITTGAFDGDAEGVASSLAVLGRDRRGLRDDAAKADAEHTEAAIELRAAEASLVEAAAARKDAADALEASTQARDRLRDRRAGMLGGESVATHRAKFEDAAREARDALAKARTDHALAVRDADAATVRVREVEGAVSTAENLASLAAEAYVAGCSASGITEERLDALFATSHDDVEVMRTRVSLLLQAVRDAEVLQETRRHDLELARAAAVGVSPPDDGNARLLALDVAIEERTLACGALAGAAAADDERRGHAIGMRRDLGSAEADWEVWAKVDEAIGSANGKRFSRLAQEVTLEALVSLANEQLDLIAPRYHLVRGEGLALHVSDIEMGGEPRGARSLSGGERFLVSLGLALALSGLEGRHGQADLLLVDEGFGSLDAASLDVAIEALEHLQAQGRRVGVVTHVAGMAERIPAQVRVAKLGGGRSVVEVHAT